MSVDRSRVAQQLPIEPFELQIGPQSYAEVVLNDEGRVPEPLRHSTVVRSVNGVAVVAERVQLSGSVVDAATGTDEAEADADAGNGDGDDTDTSGAPADTAATAAAALPPLPAGLSAAMGSPVVATEWILTLAAQADTPQAKAVITNAVMDQPVRIEVTAWSAGREVRLDLPEQASTLDARQQTEIPLTVGGDGRAVMLVVRASGPVVVDGVWVFGPSADTAFATAVPTPGGVSVPDPLGVVGLPPTSSASTASTLPAGTGSTTTTTTRPSGATTTVSSTTTSTSTPAPTTSLPPGTVATTAPPTTVAPATLPATSAPGA